MLIEIKSWITEKVLFAHECEGNTTRITLEAGVKAKADLRGSDLRDSNLSGSNLSGSDLRGSNLRGSNLRGSDLSGSDLRGSNLRGSNLSGSDLRGSNLSGSNLRGSDLSGSNLRGSDLSGSDLRGSNLSDGIPVVEDLDAKMSVCCAADGALNMKSWHTCDTTHCRAGWAIVLAGEAGKKLEDEIGSANAGTLIYLKSTGRVPDFYADNETAMADILARAAAAKESKK